MSDEHKFLCLEREQNMLHPGGILVISFLET